MDFSGPKIPPQENDHVDDTRRKSSSDRRRSGELDETTCEVCNTNKPGEWVVQCDDCNRYFHFGCVGFNDSNKDDPWSCIECTEIHSSTVIRQNERVVDGINSGQRSSTSVIEAVKSRQNTRASFQAQSLNLRQEFETRLEDLLQSYQMRDRRDLLNPVRSRTIGTGENSRSDARSHEEAYDLTATSTTKTQTGSTSGTLVS